ncbi:MAG: hypothetical protein RLY30_742 [Pseudomonadota bacterium]
MPNPARIEISGLGLAGACLLRALALSRYAGRVAVYERAAAPAQGASGNPLGIVHPLRSADHNLSSQFFDLGLLTCIDWCRNLGAEAQGWAGFCGVHEDGRPEAGGWIVPTTFVQACLDDARAWFGSRLSLHFGTAAPQRLAAPQAQTAPLGQDAHSGLGEPQTVRVACSAHPGSLQEAGLCLLPVAGQVSWVEAQPEEGPRQVLCGAGYVAPVVRGRLLVGASFDRETEEALVTAEGHAENFERLSQLDADLAARMRPRWADAQGRASVRWATRDRLPLIGQPADLLALEQHPHPQRISQLHQLPRLAHQFVLMGLGARGLTTAPLGALAVAAQILGQPAVMPDRLAEAVDPARFVLRTHRRKGPWPEAH